jgi:hypothetical protein
MHGYLELVNKWQRVKNKDSKLLQKNYKSC